MSLNLNFKKDKKYLQVSSFHFTPSANLLWKLYCGREICSQAILPIAVHAFMLISSSYFCCSLSFQCFVLCALALFPEMFFSNHVLYL